MCDKLVLYCSQIKFQIYSCICGLAVCEARSAFSVKTALLAKQVLQKLKGGVADLEALKTQLPT